MTSEATDLAEDRDRKPEFLGRFVAALQFSDLSDPETNRWKRPALFEIIAWGGCLLIVLFLQARGLRVGWQALLYSLPYLIPPLGSMLGLGLICHVVHGLLSPEGLRTRLRALALPGNLAWTLRALAATTAVSYAYIWLKVSVPLLSETLLDAALWDLDRSLHFGISPTLMVVALFEGSVLTGVMDWWYGAWMMTSFAAAGFAMLCPGSRVRHRLLASSALLWLLGACLYLALPAVGPCYTRAEAFTSVRRDMPGAVSSQEKLRANYLRVLEGRTGPLKSLNPSLGVAAMPSLHVGKHALMFLWCGLIARRLRGPLALATLATFIGSILTGWHYAVDAYVGVLLALVCWWLSGKLLRREEPS